jgi:hypothetical protein
MNSKEMPDICRTAVTGRVGKNMKFPYVFGGIQPQVLTFMYFKI